MAARRQGGIVFIGSAAAFHALPFAAAYAGSKAGLARFASALRIGLAECGVRVTLVSPGFIDTAAGQRATTPRPFEMKSADVASRIATAAAHGQAHLILPWPFAWLRLFDRLLPRSWRDRLLLRLAP
jgi:short-subunit dehydrogenase